MRKVLFTLIMLLGLPMCASAAETPDQIIRKEFENNSFYTDFAVEAERRGVDIVELGRIIDRTFNGNVFVRWYDSGKQIEVCEHTYEPYSSGASFYSINNDNTLSEGQPSGKRLLTSDLWSPNATVFKIKTFNNINYNLKMQSSTEKSMKFKYDIAPKMSMSIHDKSDVANMSTKVGFNIVPSINSNVPYKLSFRHDGRILNTDGSLFRDNVVYAFTDANGVVNGSEISYPRTVKNTTVVATPNLTGVLPKGSYRDTMDVVLSPQ